MTTTGAAEGPGGAGAEKPGGKILLVALPWNTHMLPSAALGALTAFVHAARPGATCTGAHTYLRMFEALGPYYEPIACDPFLGELIGGLLLHPDRAPDVGSYLDAWCERLGPESDFGPRAALIDRILEVSAAIAKTLAEDLAAGCDIVGFTTSYGQLLASVACARRVRERHPEAWCVLGGAGVEGRAGPPLLRAFPWIDFVVRGEGEAPLLELLDARAAGRRPRCACRGGSASLICPRCGVAADRPDRSTLAVDDLPRPSFCDYPAEADRLEIRWRIPVEGSRGCWWKPVPAEPGQGCHFCAFNACGFKERAPAVVAREVKRQLLAHRATRLQFLDNNLRPGRGVRLARALREEGLHQEMFHEVCAQVGPLDLLRLEEAGCDTVQAGIEGLCTSYLRRMGKGTTTIQNLQVMKVCAELGIFNGANLLVGFPGATEAEVLETERNIRRYAVVYPPLAVVRFHLHQASDVARRPAEHGVRAFRNAETYGRALPAALMERLVLPFQDWEPTAREVDWGPVVGACEGWQDRWRSPNPDPWMSRFDKPLHYQHGLGFTEVVDHRDGYRVFRLDGLARIVHERCHSITSVRALQRYMATTGATGDLQSAVERLVDDGLLYREGDLLLSLAQAWCRAVAVERIVARAE